MHTPKIATNTSVNSLFTTFSRRQQQTPKLTHLFLSKPTLSVVPPQAHPWAFHMVPTCLSCTQHKQHQLSQSARTSPSSLNASSKRSRFFTPFSPAPTSPSHSWKRTQKVPIWYPAAYDVGITNKISHAGHFELLHSPPSPTSSSHAYTTRSLHTLHRVSHSRGQTSL